MESLEQGLKALADPLRLRLLQVLHERGELCVCELLEAVEATQSNVSSHLRVLRAAGLVADQKIGKWVFYRLDHDAIARLLTGLNEVFDPARAGADRPAEGLFAVCCAGSPPLSLEDAQAQAQAARCCDEGKG